MKLILGTRGSKLALTQSNWVVERLKEKNPGLEVEVKIIKTKGDLIQNVALDKIGDKGLFVKEIEQELIDGKIDFAIHSMKDMPSDQPEGLKFSYCPKREDYRDILVLKKEYKTLDDVPQGGKIGSGSKRRKYQLLQHRPDLQILPIRGNVDTRIRKIDDEGLDGVVLAAAGVNRLGIADSIDKNIYHIPQDIMVPAPAQGILAIEIREDRADIDEVIKTVSCPVTMIECEAERAFLAHIEGSCHIPVGAIAKIDGENLIMDGIFGKEDGSCLVKKTIEGKKENAKNLGKELADMIIKEMEAYEG